MSNPISNLFAHLKQSRLVRATLAVVAGFMLLLNTACSPKAPEVSGTGSYEKPRTQPTEIYDTIQPKEGGMNVYSDTDPRRETDRLSAEVKARVKEAERNIDKVQTPGEFSEEYREGTPFGERVRNITDSVSETAKDVTEDVTEGTQRGVRNLKANLDKAGQGVQETFDEARQNAEDLSKDAARSAQQTTKELKGNAQRAANQVRGNAANVGEDIQDTAAEVQRSAKTYSNDLNNNLGDRS
jgi:ABC-type transporter Mla subunit MlaD